MAQISYCKNNNPHKEYLKLAKMCDNNNIVPSNLGREYNTLINDERFFNVLLPIFLEH